MTSCVRPPNTFCGSVSIAYIHITVVPLHCVLPLASCPFWTFRISVLCLFWIHHQSTQEHNSHGCTPGRHLFITSAKLVFPTFSSSSRLIHCHKTFVVYNTALPPFPLKPFAAMNSNPRVDASTVFCSFKYQRIGARLIKIKTPV